MFIIASIAKLFVLHFVLIGSRSRIAPQPELLDELFALLIRLQLLERGALLVADDVGHVLREPPVIRRALRRG